MNKKVKTLKKWNFEWTWACPVLYVPYLIKNHYISSKEQDHAYELCDVRLGFDFVKNNEKMPKL